RTRHQGNRRGLFERPFRQELSCRLCQANPTASRTPSIVFLLRICYGLMIDASDRAPILFPYEFLACGFLCRRRILDRSVLWVLSEQVFPSSRERDSWPPRCRRIARPGPTG